MTWFVTRRLYENRYSWVGAGTVADTCVRLVGDVFLRGQEPFSLCVGVVRQRGFRVFENAHAFHTGIYLKLKAHRSSSQ